MTTHIDVGTVLRQTLSAELYSNLVTRPTGRAVRRLIEDLLSSTSQPSLAVIDFSHVSMIDFSCADEVVAKLLMAEDREAYFVFRGMSEDHWHAIEQVLECHRLALVVEREDGMELKGVLDDVELRAWGAVNRRARAATWEVAMDLGESEPAARSALERLWRRRLLMRRGDTYMPVGEIS
jgi:hypothetical protein